MKIKHIVNEPVSGERTIDWYVPISIQYRNNNAAVLEQRYYYHILNKESSFVEMVIDSISLKIVDITVVSINKLYEDIQDSPISDNINTIIGNPVIDPDIFHEDNHIDVNCDFKVYTYNRIIFIILDGKVIKQKINFDGTEILLDGDNHIAGFIFKDFTDEDWAEMYAGIKKL